MVANLFGSRFVGFRAPGWHALGTTVQEQITAREALKVGGIDYQFVSAPVGYTLPDGTFISDDDRIAVLRTPTAGDEIYRRLGFASPGYTYLQNDQLADGLDAIAAKTGWHFETVGALGHGQITFLTLNAGKRSVFGDEYDQYFMVSDGKVAGRTLQITVSPVRTVCANTLAAAESSATTNVKIPHNQAITRDFAFWVGLVGSLEKSRENAFLSLEHMASRKISRDEALSIISAAYPLPAKNQKARQAQEIADDDTIDDETKAVAADALKSGEEAYAYYFRHAVLKRDAAATLYDRFNDGDEQGGRLSKKVLAKVASTPYAALQAVTELADWGGSGKDSAIAASALFGDRSKVKARAWTAALLSASSSLIPVPLNEEVAEHHVGTLVL